MMRQLLTAAAALALLGACGGTTDPAPDNIVSEPAAPGSAAEPGSAPGPSDPQKIPARVEGNPSGPSPDTVIDIKQDMLTASASIDGQITDFAPALAQRLKSEIDVAFEKAEAIAAADAEEGFDSPHDYQYRFEKTASVGDILSVEFFHMVHTGGAHPNYLLGGLLHDRASGEDLFPSEILSEPGTAAMKALLLEKLAEAKRERLSMEAADMPALREEVAELFPKEIEFWFGQVIFLPSTTADQFGGLTVRFSPYDVGAYAEGGYELMVTAEELDGMLNERFAPMFGGEPVISQDD